MNKSASTWPSGFLVWAVALLAVSPLGVNPGRAQSAALTASPTVLTPAGGTVSFTLTATFADLAIFGLEVAAPAGWTYQSGTGEPGIKPVAGTSGTLGWADTNLLAGPVSFRFVLAYPAGTTTASVSASVILRPPGSPRLTLVPPAVNFGAGSPPAITTPPASLAVNPGASAAFAVTASGPGTLVYQWMKGAAPLAGATGAALVLNGVQPADAGAYAVVVSNAWGTVTSTAATLTVGAPVVGPVGAPVITAAPASQSVRPGTNVTLSVTASGGAPLSYQWRKDGVALAGATAATLTLSAVGSAAAGTYTVVVTNSAGSATATAAVLGVTARTVPGAYFGTFGGNGGTFALYVRSDRTGVFLGYARSARVACVSREVLVDANGHFAVTTAAVAPLPGTAAAAPTYGIDGTIGADGALSGTVSGLNLTLSAPAAASGATAAVAGFYQAGAALSAAVSYAIIGAAGDAYVVTVSGAGADAGRGTVDTNGRVAVTTENQVAVAGTIQTATLALTTTGAGGAAVVFVGANSELRTQTEQLINLSTRCQAGAGANVLIAGFVITGSQPKAVLVRGIGPSLAQFGVAGALAAARLEIFQGATSLAVGNDWGAGANSAAIAAAAASVGAFPLAATGHDAALLLTLDPGAYTAVVSGQNNVTGVSLAEVYDATVGPIPAAQRLINISSRATVAAEDSALIGGFVIAGTVPKRVLIRGAGPSLAQFGLTGLLARPQLLLFKGSQTLAQNAGWSASADASAIAAAAAQVGAFAFPAGSADAAVLVHLEPGAYTAQVVGVGGATGIALVEIYEVP